MRIGTSSGLIRHGLAWGYGLVDLLTEWIDQKQGWTDPIRNSTFAQRAVVYALSLGLNLADVETDLTEVLANASAPLLAKSIKNIIQTYTKSFHRPRATSSVSRGIIRRVTSTPRSSTAPQTLPGLVSF